MSFGFIRKQSPASIADQRRRAAGRRFKLLRDMKIAEVSSVDRAANPGARVVLMKRDTSEKGNGTMTMQDQIAKSLGQAATGEITFAKAASEQMDRALSMFPQSKSAGAAMAEYLKTETGRRDVQNLKDLEFLRSQWDNRIGDGATAVLKHGDDGTPQIHFDNSRDGAVDRDSPDDEGVEEPYGKRHKRLTDAGFSGDEAHSMLHRMERLKRGY
jgi:hypothetical protein